MTRDEKIVAIEFTYAVTHGPSQTRVKTKTITHFGFFQPLYDSAELRLQGKYRFIPINNSQAFQNIMQYPDPAMTPEEKKKQTLATSIVLDVEDIEHIDLVIPK